MLAAAIVLWSTLGVAVAVEYQLLRIAREWPAIKAQVEERASGELRESLEDLVDRGERAVVGASQAFRSADTLQADPRLFSQLAALRGATDMSAIAVFDADGRPLAWAGEHRGEVPAEVLRGERAYVFQEGPLFSYIYFVSPMEDGGDAVAAVLLEGDLALGEGVVPFAEDFADRHGLLPRFTLPSRAEGDAIWDWSTDIPIMSVSFATLTQQRWWDRVVHRGLLFVGFLWLLALTLLSLSWYGGRIGPPGVPVAVTTAGLLLVPIGRIIGNQTLFSPLRFVLPAGGDISLGLLIIVLIGLSVWILMRVDRARSARRVAPRIAIAAAALLFPAGLALMRRSTAAGLLAEEIGGGFPLQFATTLLLTIPLYLLLSFSASARSQRRLYSPFLAILSAVLLGAIVIFWWEPARTIPAWFPIFWAIPFGILIHGLRRFRVSRSSFGIWLLAALLAASATLPYFWLLHMDARLASAERELARLGTEADPFLDFLLRQFAEHARDYAAQGEEGVNLLYHSWIASGLAQEGYEAHLASWTGGEMAAELRLTDVDRLPERLPELVAEHSIPGDPVVRRFTTLEALHYLLVVPLPGQTIAVAIPPRTQLGRSTALSRFLRPENGEEQGTPVESLFLVPVPDEPGLAAAPDTMVSWIATAAGWRSEARVRFPSGWMHAHLLVRTSSVPLRVVRMLLIVTALLGVMALLWIIARALAGQLRVSASQLRLIRSFRGRLTLALFAFFLVPTAFFAAVTYGAVSNEVVRSAAVLARRTLQDAVTTGRGLGADSPGTQDDLLLYRRGTLVGSTASEVLDLGLFHSWLPPRVYLQFSTGEDLEALEERQLGNNNYLIAYRRLNPTTVVGAPIPLASDEITRRQREFAYVTALMILLGLALSLVLSLLVGRALARPLDEMSRAAARVGSGNLQLRLPEERVDEFGSVYRSFNSMVSRLRSARAALVRETRRTETIVAEAATGVLALDVRGGIELANPRAAQILGRPLQIGEPLPRSDDLLMAIHEMVEAFRSEGVAEGGKELEIAGRVVRIRLRRLSENDEPGGTVLALEDITSEIRSARVLAWGEMARQVAHEIKNPLTPIKLSVQHLRRAHADRHPDFEAILDRNVDAILKEIDALGEISRAFSRFGSPAAEAGTPEPIEVSRVVEDTIALYRSGRAKIDFRVQIEPSLPRAYARSGELKEVLINLLENARDALDGIGGSVQLTLSATDDRSWVKIDISDTGEGIPAELLPQVFEPHFSTRTSGTGLGLAIVRRLVESWGGEVTAHSRTGEGTEIRLRLRTA